MNRIKTALVCGISGQDGAYLSKFLLSKGYKVWGTSRDVDGKSFSNLQQLGILKNVKLVSMAPEDFRSVLVVLKQSKPDEIYFLAGQSSVGLSFNLPAETIQSISIGTLNILEAVRMLEPNIKVYTAGSSECYGNNGQLANEKTPFKPESPYAVAKTSAYWLVANYRQAYGLFACTGILFNHESPLRPERFVTQKIISTVKRIASGSKELLKLGRLDISRDWGWAPEYVEAMWLMLQLDSPQDFVIGTGESYQLQEFVEYAFSIKDLDWKNYVEIDVDLMRPNEISLIKADPNLAIDILNWRAKFKMKDVVERMMFSDIR